MATTETTGPLSKEELIALSKEVISRVVPQLEGTRHDVAGAVLLNLFATWLCNHRPSERDAVLATWLNGLADMMRAADRIRAATIRKPPDKLDS